MAKNSLTAPISSASRLWHPAPLFSVLLIAGSLLLTMALAEGVLRLVPGLLSVELQQLIQADADDRGTAHPYIGYLHKPNNTFILAGRDFRAAAHTDRHGFRNAWPWPEKAEIVAVGDSLTFGYGVEDDQTWPALVAKELPHTRLINLGLIGGGPQQYLRVYETFGTRLYPKVVLIGFFARNDFWDAAMFHRWLESGAGTNYLVWRDFGQPESTSLGLEQPIGDFLSSLLWRCHLLASQSHLYNLLRYAPKRLERQAFVERRTFQAPDGARVELSLESSTSATEARSSGYRPFDIAVEALQRLHSIAKADGTNVIVVLQPSKEEVYLPLLGEPAPDQGRSLRVRLRELGIPYLDLLPGFRRRAKKGEVLFFEVDGHPNRRGYALTAELVLTHLKNNAKRYDLTDSVRTSSP
jgi:SGNH hydrolase-like domain, acetyltransferase AlgX